MYTQFSDIFFGEDLLLSLYPLTEAESIKYLDIPLYKYRMSDGSICRTLNTKKLNSILAVYNEMYRYIPIWSKDYNLFHYCFLKTYGTTIINFFASSIVQGGSYRETTFLLDKIRLSDTRFIEYLNEILSRDLALSRKQQILGMVIKHKLYSLVYLFYRMRRLTTGAKGKSK